MRTRPDAGGNRRHLPRNSLPPLLPKWSSGFFVKRRLRKLARTGLVERSLVRERSRACQQIVTCSATRLTVPRQPNATSGTNQDNRQEDMAIGEIKSSCRSIREFLFLAV